MRSRKRFSPLPVLRLLPLLALLVAGGAALPSPASAGGRHPHGHAHGHGHGFDACARLERLQRLFEWLEAHSHAPRVVGLLRREISAVAADRCVAMNQIQSIGTHNSYHIRPRLDLLQVFAGIDPAATEWEYTRKPLGEELETLGIRQIELDVFADPEGGLYADRLALGLIGEDTASGIAELDEPGFKVLHVQHADFLSTCLTFVACLEEVKRFSDAHPRHVPIQILIEAKDEAFFTPVLPEPVPIGAAELHALEDEILSVFPRDRIVTPDLVRGDFPSVEDAIMTRGWPRLGEVRGRVIFMLDNAAKRDALVDGDPSLAGRIIFPNATPGDPDAAFVKANDPVSDPTLIPELVDAGYLVRTRADAGLQEGRSGDHTRSEIALASGAQAVSTDFPEPTSLVSIDPMRPFDPTYEVVLPEGAAARCNPINAPEICRSDGLE